MEKQQILCQKGFRVSYEARQQMAMHSEKKMQKVYFYHFFFVIYFKNVFVSFGTGCAYEIVRLIIMD